MLPFVSVYFNGAALGWKGSLAILCKDCFVELGSCVLHILDELSLNDTDTSRVDTSHEMSKMFSSKPCKDVQFNVLPF